MHPLGVKRGAFPAVVEGGEHAAWVLRREHLEQGAAAIAACISAIPLEEGIFAGWQRQAIVLDVQHEHFTTGYLRAAVMEGGHGHNG